MNSKDQLMQQTPFDAVAVVVRSLVLYSLAEFQAGYATEVNVSIAGRTFKVSDDGRGHAINRETVGGHYLQFIYSQLDYPFDDATNAPIQLQGIGMSLLHSLCSELVVAIRKRSESLELTFKQGRLLGEKRRSGENAVTGNLIQGVVIQDFPARENTIETTRDWLAAVIAVNPRLMVALNDIPLNPVV